MYRTFLIVLAAGLANVSAVSADIPLPKNLKYIDPRVSFEGIDQQKDYVFYLRFLTFTGAPTGVPHTLIQVKDSNAFNLKAQRRLSNLQLLAMDRKEFEKRAKDDPSLKWLNDKTEGVLKASVAAPSTVAASTVKEAPVTTYRVTLKDGKLSVEMVDDNKRSDAGPDNLMPTWAFALISSLSLVWFGVWFARGKIKR